MLAITTALTTRRLISTHSWSHNPWDFSVHYHVPALIMSSFSRPRLVLSTACIIRAPAARIVAIGSLDKHGRVQPATLHDRDMSHIKNLRMEMPGRMSSAKQVPAHDSRACRLSRPSSTLCQLTSQISSSLLSISRSDVLAGKYSLGAGCVRRRCP